MIGIVCSLVLPIVVGIPKDRFPVAIFSQYGGVALGWALQERAAPSPAPPSALHAL